MSFAGNVAIITGSDYTVDGGRTCGGMEWCGTA